MRFTTRFLATALTTLALGSSGCSSDSSPVSPTDVQTPPPPTPPAPPAGPGTPVVIAVKPDRSQLVAGGTVQLVDTARDERGLVNATEPIRWITSDSTIATVSAAGLVTALRAGEATITAATDRVGGSAIVTITAAPGTTPTPPTDPTPAPPTPPTTPPTPPTTPPPPTNPTPPSATWTRCASSGGECDFIGLRDVRIGGPNGPWVQQQAYQLQYCLMGYFPGLSNPAPGQTLHCEYGPLKTETLVNPNPGMGGLGSSVVVALGDPGTTSTQTRTTTDNGAPSGDGEGAFRTVCGLSHFAFDDPIMLPGQPGKSHLHVFFGNAGANASSTVSTVANSGRSTCFGGTLNRTAYWVPALIDSRTGEVLTPDRGVFYYKTGSDMDPATIQPIPAGLRMIAGDKSSTGPQDYVVDWGCRDKWHPNTGYIPTDCPVGDAIRLAVIFPNCWDGKNLDSPDHKSHMAYYIYSNTRNGSHCPADHPIAIPTITEHFDYPITATSNPSTWRLSSDMYSTSIPGGLSAHADWMGGWDPTTMQTFVTKCLNKRLDCGVGTIGNGTELF